MLLLCYYALIMTLKALASVFIPQKSGPSQVFEHLSAEQLTDSLLYFY